ncbi:unnamed protein product [Mytilus coruscus]|uniref:Peptidase A2 domain-containing protein n=1 Tax=Mytilus coruscus TaxID=42192 RepID=A0A6J8B998_MYTCO|nr:unnamed protein product [Mytilus coruscus]
MLVDTGSAVTLISKNVYEKLGEIKPKLTEVSTILTTADGEPMKVMGASNLLLQLNNHGFIHSAIVADLGDIAGILGLDFLSKYEVTISASQGTLTFPNFTVKLLIDSDVQATCARVQLADTVQVPGRAKMIVREKIDADLTGNVDSILEPIDGFQGEKHVLIPKSVVQTSDTEVVFSILNPTPHAVILKRNLTVASLQPIKEIMEENFQQPTSSTEKSVKIPEHLQALTENVSDNLTFSQRSDIGKAISEYADVFVGPDGKLGRTDLVEHSILTETDRPVKVLPRRLPISQREVAAAEIDKMLKNDIIEPSHSPYSAPIVLDEVKYLGHVVSADGIKCDPEKINSVKNWPVPESVSDVRSFLGIASYYRKFIDKFSTIAFPLTQLTCKDKRFIWTDECQESFVTLKNALISTKVLAYPMRTDKFIIDTDASNFGMGAVLSQVQNGEERVIAYGVRPFLGLKGDTVRLIENF